MNILQSIILGIVEGITEFLPVSSTAHIVFATKILQISATQFTKSFDIIIQSGAILAAVLFFGKKIMSSRQLMLKSIVGFIPTGIVGLLLYKKIKELLGNGSAIAWVLILGGIAMLFLERYFKDKEDREGKDEIDTELGMQAGVEGKVENQEGMNPVEIKLQKTYASITLKKAFLIGCYQCLALIPGVSRSAATVYGGRLLNISREKAVDFSFMLAIPTMVVATLYDIYKNASSFNNDQLGVLAVGFLASFFVAYAVIASLLSFIKKNSFNVFAWYRIIVGILALLFIF